MATGKELECPKETITRHVSQLQIAANAESANWIELDLKRGPNPRDQYRTDEPHEIARWTRESGKVVRKAITPALGGVHIAVAADGQSAVVLPEKDYLVPAQVRQNEFWDLSGDTPKLLKNTLSWKTGSPRTHAVSGFDTGSAGAVATVHAHELFVYRPAASEPLWRMPLPANFSAQLVGVSGDGHRVVFFDAETLRVCERRTGSVGPRQFRRRPGPGPLAGT